MRDGRDFPCGADNAHLTPTRKYVAVRFPRSWRNDGTSRDVGRIAANRAEMKPDYELR